jgi:hypothetical protein
VHFESLKIIPSPIVRCKYTEGPPNAILLLGSKKVPRKIKETLPFRSPMGSCGADINGNNFAF